MSIILDALRRGPAKQTPGSIHSAAQTDAVLHTLGYGRAHATVPLNRLKGSLGLVAVVILFAIGLWTGVWIAEQSGWLVRTPATQSHDNLRKIFSF